MAVSGLKFSLLNGVSYDPTTDSFVGVRNVAGVFTDYLITLPTYAQSANMTVTGTASTAVIGAAAGTGATVTVGNDNGGVIVLTTGAPAGIGTLATVTFNLPYPNGSSVVLMPADAATAAVITDIYAAGTKTGWTISTTTALTDSTAYMFNYLVLGN